MSEDLSPAINDEAKTARNRAGGRAINRFFIFTGLGIWIACVIWALVADIGDLRPAGTLQFRIGVGGAILCMLSFFVMLMQKLWVVRMRLGVTLPLTFLFFFACWGGVVGLGFLLGSALGMNFSR